MEPESLERTIAELVSLALGCPADEALQLTRDTAGGWDSLKHMEILFAVEDELGIQFREDELGQLGSVRAIIDATSRHLAA